MTNPTTITPVEGDRTCIGVLYIPPSLAWEDLLRGPPAAASIAHVRRLLAWRVPRTSSSTPLDSSPALRLAA